MTATSEPTAVITIDAGTIEAAATRDAALETLEGGGVVVLNRGFTLTDRERALVADTSITLPTRRERESRNGRPTVTWDPDRGKIERTRIREPHKGELTAMMVRYSEWAETTVLALFPEYASALVRDRVTFRPCLRSKPQGLHVDASYGRPTEGRGMLRIFANIDPEERPRRWQVGERFEPFAQHFLPLTRSPRPSLASRVLAGMGLTKGRRTAYDALIADLRQHAKRDDTYQAEAPRRVVDFAPGSAWIAITDLVLHGALAGRNSLDQTFFLPAAGMRSPERSSLSILERLSGRPLA